MSSIWPLHLQASGAFERSKEFLNLSKTPLHQLSRLLGLSLNAADPLIDIIKGLVLHCFQKIKDGELLRILMQRTVFGDQMQDLLKLLEKQDLATADDEKDIAAVKADLEANETGHRGLH